MINVVLNNDNCIGVVVDEIQICLVNLYTRFIRNLITFLKALN